MIIRKKRIRSLTQYAPFLKKYGRVALGIGELKPHRAVLRRLGFTDPPVSGESLLPAADFGPASRYNAEGKEVVHRDQPMETAYRTVEWRWVEWHGPYREEQSRFVDVPYKRYPRTMVPPSSIELMIATESTGKQILVTRVLEYPNDEELLLRAINLLLEIFGECDFFTDQLDQILRVPVRRLNWRVLPPGQRPWAALKKDISPVLGQMSEGNRVVAEHRLETINSYKPDFAAVGTAGFHGYIILGFKTRNLYVLESLFYGNATYVFAQDWKKLSKLTKAEVLSQKRQKDRIIHREGWENRVRSLFVAAN